MNLKITQHIAVPGDPVMRSPLLYNRRTRPEAEPGRGDAIQRVADTHCRREGVHGTSPCPGQDIRNGRQALDGGISMGQQGLRTDQRRRRLAWDFNSDRPFNPQALLALLKSGAKVRDEGPVSGLGWTGTRYRFTFSHPDGTGRLVDFITCTVDVDSQGHVRSLAPDNGFAAGGKPGAASRADLHARLHVQRLRRALLGHPAAREPDRPRRRRGASSSEPSTTRTTAGGTSRRGTGPMSRQPFVVTDISINAAHGGARPANAVVQLPAMCDAESR